MPRVIAQGPLDLSSIFDLRFRDTDVFEGSGPDYAWGSAYGGLLVAQALWAATMTVPETLGVHSLHAYFVRAGAPSEPVRYAVERVRDGRSFSTRRVVAKQSTGEVLTLSSSFQASEPSLSWQPRSPLETIAGPEGVDGYWDAGIDRRDAVFDQDPPRVATWLRFPEALDHDPRLHACALAYLSDLNPIDAGVAAHPDPPAAGQWSSDHLCVSLDHSIWFHSAAKCDDWLLMDLFGRRFAGQRVFATGRTYTRDGVHIASIAQEGLLRLRERQS